MGWNGKERSGLKPQDRMLEIVKPPFAIMRPAVLHT